MNTTSQNPIKTIAPHPASQNPDDAVRTPALPMLPVLQAACSLHQSVHFHHPHLSLDDMVNDLQSSLYLEKAGDMDLLLVTQARVLDSIFNRLVLTSLAKGEMDERRMQTALQLQRQCRQTIEALRRVEQKSGRAHRSYPWPAAPFADPQKTAEDIEMKEILRQAENEIMEYENAQKNKRLAARAAAKAGESDSEMEALDEEYGS